MRTYSSGSKAKGRRFLKKHYAIILGVSILLVALIITLSLTLGLRKPAVVEKPTPDVPVVVPPAMTFVPPLAESSVKEQSTLNGLVWNETLGQWRSHDGVDFAANEGDAVFSIAKGVVANVEETLLDGVVVTIKHDEGYVSVYKGLKSASVKVSDKLDGGASIGNIGAMLCENDRGAHLHLEMQKNGEYVSVMDYLESDK